MTAEYHRPSIKNQKSPNIVEGPHHLPQRGHDTGDLVLGVEEGHAALIEILGTGQGHAAEIGIPGEGLEVETEDPDHPVAADGVQDIPGQGRQVETDIDQKGLDQETGTEIEVQRINPLMILVQIFQDLQT